LGHLFPLDIPLLLLFTPFSFLFLLHTLFYFGVRLFFTRGWLVSGGAAS
jgi:hypothetical protein